MVSALSSICFREKSLVVLSDGESVWVGFLNVARSLVRSVCTEWAVASVSPPTSSAHWLSKGCGMGNWNRVVCVCSLLVAVSVAVGGLGRRRGMCIVALTPLWSRNA